LCSAGVANGTGANARFHNPLAITVDRTTGNLFVSDGNYLQPGGPSMEYCTIRKITPSGEVTTLAGDPSYVDRDYGYGERDGTGANAKFARIFGMAVDPQGVLYVADTYARKIKRVTQDGVATTWAGLKMADGSDMERFYPAGIVFDGSGNLIATDFSSNVVYRISPDGLITKIGGVTGVMGRGTVSARTPTSTSQSASPVTARASSTSPMQRTMPSVAASSPARRSSPPNPRARRWRPAAACSSMSRRPVCPIPPTNGISMVRRSVAQRAAP
jgi:hypothetical protein